MSELKAETAAFKAAIAKCTQKVAKGVNSGFRKWCTFVLGLIKAGVSQRLHRHTGTLLRSTTVAIKGEKVDAAATFAARTKYAHMQEHGGTIRAVRAKMLAIPVEGSPVLTNSGVSRVGSPLRTTLPAAFPDYNFWVMKSGGRLLLMGAKQMKAGKSARGKKTRAQPWFVLKRSVKLPSPGRLRMRETIEKAIATLKRDVANEVNRG